MKPSGPSEDGTVKASAGASLKDTPEHAADKGGAQPLR